MVLVVSASPRDVIYICGTLLVVLRSCSSSTMHYMALSFVQRIAQSKSHLTIPDSWLHKTAGTREGGNDGVGKFSIASL